MRISFRAVGALVCMTLIAAMAVPQDGLGKKRGGGGSGVGNGGGGNSGGGNSGGGNSGGGSTGGGQTGGGGLGRVDNGGGRSGGGNSGGNIGGGSIVRPPQRGNDTIVPGRGQNNQVPIGRGIRQSRSGNVNYGTINNLKFDKNSFRIERPKVGILDMLDHKIKRSESRVGVIHGNNYGYRTGYHHWNYNWRDDYFWYPYYIFDPFSYNRFVCSPWYYYSFLPPYMSMQRVIIVNNYYGYTGWSGDRYEWRRPADNTRYDRDRELDYAVDDLARGFENGDRRSINRLLPRSGSVAVYMDGRYNYSLNPDDFYDLLMDLMENSRTRSYTIEDVRYGRNMAKVSARHEYLDSWGSREIVYHEYMLEQERGGFVIREFGTSGRR